MNTWRDACESQQQKLNLTLKKAQAKAVSNISLKSDFIKGVHWVANLFSIVKWVAFLIRRGECDPRPRRGSEPLLCVILSLCITCEWTTLRPRGLLILYWKSTFKTTRKIEACVFKYEQKFELRNFSNNSTISSKCFKSERSPVESH
jgi:hypothetical protein